MEPSYAHLTQLIPPDSRKYTPSKAYVDSVKMITHDGKKALLISGNLANSCTKLQKANHVVLSDSLAISITAWKPAGKTCAQALVPFQFIYDKVAQKKWQHISTVIINQNHFDLK